MERTITLGMAFLTLGCIILILGGIVCPVEIIHSPKYQFTKREEIRKLCKEASYLYGRQEFYTALEKLERAREILNKNKINIDKEIAYSLFTRLGAVCVNISQRAGGDKETKKIFAQRAIDPLRIALRVDPEDSLAWLGLARANILLWEATGDQIYLTEVWEQLSRAESISRVIDPQDHRNLRNMIKDIRLYLKSLQFENTIEEGINSL